MFIDCYMSIHAAAHADDLFGVGWVEAEHGREGETSGVDAIATTCESGAAGVDDHGREHSERMPPNTMLRVELLGVADVGQFPDKTESAVVAKCKMVDPID